MDNKSTGQHQRRLPPELEALDRPPMERVARAERSQVMWSWIAAIAMVFILGVTFYAIDTRLDERHARQTSPAAPSLASSHTTSPAAPAEIPVETTGQGGSTNNNAAGDQSPR